MAVEVTATLGKRLGMRIHDPHIAGDHAGLKHQAVVNREHDLPPDLQRRAVDEKVGGVGHDALEAVLDRHDASSAVPSSTARTTSAILVNGTSRAGSPDGERSVGRVRCDRVRGPVERPLGHAQGRPLRCRCLGTQVGKLEHQYTMVYILTSTVHIFVPRATLPVPCRSTFGVGSRHVHPSPDQQLHHLKVAVYRRHMQRRTESSLLQVEAEVRHQRDRIQRSAPAASATRFPCRDWTRPEDPYPAGSPPARPPHHPTCTRWRTVDPVQPRWLRPVRDQGSRRGRGGPQSWRPPRGSCRRWSARRRRPRARQAASLGRHGGCALPNPAGSRAPGPCRIAS